MAIFMAVAALVALAGLRGGVQQATGAEAGPAGAAGDTEPAARQE